MRCGKFPDLSKWKGSNNGYDGWRQEPDKSCHTMEVSQMIKQPTRPQYAPKHPPQTVKAAKGKIRLPADIDKMQRKAAKK